MKRISINGLDHAWPFADLFRDLTKREFARIEAGIRKAKEITYPVITYKSERWGLALLDGGHRCLIGLALGIEIPVLCLGRMTDEAAREKAIELHVGRRNLSIEEQIEAKWERVEKAHELRGQGASIRTIAEETGVSREQARRDLAESPAEAGDTPVSREEPTEIQGRDGKTYTAPAAATSTRPPGRKVSGKERAANAAKQIQGMVPNLLKSDTTRSRFLALADTHGVPIDRDDEGKWRWSALDAVAATLRDLSGAKIMGGG